MKYYCYEAITDTYHSFIINGDFTEEMRVHICAIDEEVTIGVTEIMQSLEFDDISLECYFITEINTIKSLTSFCDNQKFILSTVKEAAKHRQLWLELDNIAYKNITYNIDNKGKNTLSDLEKIYENYFDKLDTKDLPF